MIWESDGEENTGSTVKDGLLKPAEKPVGYDKRLWRSNSTATKPVKEPTKG